MALETANWISELVITNPDGDLDTPEEGDDHIRMIKKVLDNHFGGLPNEALDTAFVKKAGDTMTGDLTVDTDVTVSGLLSADGGATVGVGLAVAGDTTVGSLGVAGLATGQTPAASANNKEFATTDWVQTVLAAAPAGVSTQVMVVKRQLANGTSGGAGISGSWQRQALNTTSFNNITGATLASGVVTLPPGTYILDQSATFDQSENTQTAILIGGTRHYGGCMHLIDQDDVRATLTTHAAVTLASGTAVEVQYRIGSSGGGMNTIGQPCSYGAEVYVQMTITKIA